MLKKIVKKGIGYYAPYLTNMRKIIANGLTIFLFHDISDNPSEFNQKYRLSLSKKVFKDQIIWINNNFTIIHPEEILLDKKVKNAAVITFDDGCKGVFENALPILNTLKIPSIIFLNMSAVIDKKPLMSSVASYLSTYQPGFKKFAISNEICPPYHLSLTPELMKKAVNLFEISNDDFKKVLTYQGEFASLKDLYKWQNSNYVVYGNHLFDHWNAASLTIEQLQEEYTKNQEILEDFPNSVNFFAFPNGMPNKCFSEIHIKTIKKIGAKKVFSAVSGVNRDSDEFLLGRFNFTDLDVSPTDYWYKLFRTIYTT